MRIYRALLCIPCEETQWKWTQIFALEESNYRVFLLKPRTNLRKTFMTFFQVLFYQVNNNNYKIFIAF